MTIEIALDAYTLGPYVLGQRLGHGGMGEVWVAARLDGTGSPVALKLLHHHLSGEVPAVEMFLNEARLVARMVHPNVVPILDVGSNDGRYWLAMELVSGVSLATLIDALEHAGLQLPPDQVLHVAHGLCEGLHHAHTLNDEYGLPLSIVHRDVSPHNVLVSVNGEVKVTDFGIAQAQTSPHHTQPGRVRGKCEYLSPEQARGRLVDRRADVFAAASTIAHLATLKSPFFRGSIAGSMRAVVTEAFPDVRAQRADLSPRFAATLLKAARKHPDDRFESARAFADALPRPRAGAAEALGALVRRLCATSLEATLHAARKVETQTGSRSASMVMGATPADTEIARVPVEKTTSTLPRRAPALPKRMLAAGIAFAATLAVAAVAWPVDVEQPVEVELVVPAVVDSQPEVELAAEPVTIETPAAPAVAARKPRPPRAPAPTAGTGWLTVDADPWAEVWLDGKKIGETPIASHAAEAGTARLVLKNPSIGNVERSVTIRRGHETFVREVLQ